MVWLSAQGQSVELAESPSQRHWANLNRRELRSPCRACRLHYEEGCLTSASGDGVPSEHSRSRKALRCCHSHTCRTLPTKDLLKARAFYEDTLGFTPERESAAGVSHQSGGGMVFLYESEYAGTNKATAVSFDVPMSAFDDEISALRRASHS